MTEHPAAKCTKRQREVFEQIAVGNDLGHHRRTIDALTRKGLVEQIGTRVLGRDALGAITIPIYEVPIPLHMQFCRWASENIDDEEGAR